MIEEMSATPFLLKQMTGIDSIINSTMRSHPLILRRLMNLYDSNPPDKESMLQVFKSIIDDNVGTILLLIPDQEVSFTDSSVTSSSATVPDADVSIEVEMEHNETTEENLDRLCQDIGGAVFTDLLWIVNIHPGTEIAELEADCRFLLTELNHNFCPVALGRGFTQKFPYGLKLGNSAVHLVTLRSKVWFTSEPTPTQFPLLAAAYGFNKRIGGKSLRTEYLVQPCTALNEHEAYNHVSLAYVRGL